MCTNQIIEAKYMTDSKYVAKANLIIWKSPFLL